MSSAGHSEHFLRRLDRVADGHVELALALYRDADLLRDVLARADLDDGAERVAISLDHPIEGPFVIVTREGRFVTCLGPGMRVTEGDVAIVTRARLDAAAAKVERMRERVAELARLREAGADGVARRLLKRLRQDGLRVCREDVATLGQLWPLVGTEGVVVLGMGIRLLREHREHVALTRFDRMRPADEDALRAYGGIAWTCGHLLVLCDREASGEVIERVAGDGPHDARMIWAMTIFDLGTYAHVMRALWSIARRARQALPALKGLREDPRYAMRVLRETGLGAVALASPKLRAEATKALWSDGMVASAPGRLGTWCARISKSAADVVRGVLARPAEMEAVYESYGRAVAARMTHRVREPTDAQLADVPADVARAWIPSLAASVSGQDGPERMGLILPGLHFLAKASATDLYLPREHASRLRETGLEDAIEMMRDYGKDRFIERQATERRDAPKVGRNEPCPCGSGKKHKRCCGAISD